MANRASQLLRNAVDLPDRVALISDGVSVTFAALAAETRQMAGGLTALGIGQGDHIGIWLPSTTAFIVVEQALFMIGAVVTPINVQYRPNEVRYAADCCDLGWIVTTSALAVSLGDDPPCAIAVTDTGRVEPGTVSVCDAAAASSPVQSMAEVGDDDLAMLLLTSATTGKAKGVMLTAGNLSANYDRTPEWLGLDTNCVILCALPLYNTFGLNQGINATMVTGGTLVLQSRFDAEACIAAIARHRCTFLPAVPTMLQKIIDHPAATPEALGSLRTVMTGGAPVPSTLLRRLKDLAPDVTLLTGYGLTEGTALVTLTEVALSQTGTIDRERTIGKTLDGMEVAILDDAGAVQSEGTCGEIAVRGPNIMAGYYKAPDDTAAALQDTWLRTGDIGYVDSEGYAFIVDRKKDVIIRGGQNIYPADIEEVLYAFPGVAEAAVVARGDPMLGEVPVAFVALRPGATASTADLLEHCRASLATFKCPVAIEVCRELPKGPTGKILRRALRPMSEAA